MDAKSRYLNLAQQTLDKVIEIYWNDTCELINKLFDFDEFEIKFGISNNIGNYGSPYQQYYCDFAPHHFSEIGHTLEEIKNIQSNFKRHEPKLLAEPYVDLCIESGCFRVVLTSWFGLDQTKNQLIHPTIVKKHSIIKAQKESNILHDYALPPEFTIKQKFKPNIIGIDHLPFKERYNISWIENIQNIKHVETLCSKYSSNTIDKPLVWSISENNHLNVLWKYLVSTARSEESSWMQFCTPKER